MLGKQRIHNLCDGNCETTFKNLLRGPEKMVTFLIIRALSSKGIQSS